MQSTMQPWLWLMWILLILVTVGDSFHHEIKAGFQALFTFGILATELGIGNDIKAGIQEFEANAQHTAIRMVMTSFWVGKQNAEVGPQHGPFKRHGPKVPTIFQAFWMALNVKIWVGANKTTSFCHSFSFLGISSLNYISFSKAV